MAFSSLKTNPPVDELTPLSSSDSETDDSSVSMIYAYHVETADPKTTLYQYTYECKTPNYAPSKTSLDVGDIADFMFERFVMRDVPKIKLGCFHEGDSTFDTREIALAKAKSKHPNATVISIFKLSVCPNDIKAGGITLSRAMIQAIYVHKIQPTVTQTKTKLYAYLEGDIMHHRTLHQDFDLDEKHTIIEVVRDFFLGHPFLNLDNFTINGQTRVFKTPEEAFTVAKARLAALPIPSARQLTILTLEIPSEQKLDAEFIKKINADAFIAAKVYAPQTMDFKKPLKTLDAKQLSMPRPIIDHTFFGSKTGAKAAPICAKSATAPAPAAKAPLSHVTLAAVTIHLAAASGRGETTLFSKGVETASPAATQQKKDHSSPSHRLGK